MTTRPAASPNPIDAHVGRRVRMRRREIGMSQQTLADRLNLTFQQVQKYERGLNRISASKLFEIAEALEAPVGFFFDGAAPSAASTASRSAAAPWGGLGEVLMTDPGGPPLAQAYLAIKSRRVRRRMVELMQALATAGEDGGGTPA